MICTLITAPCDSWQDRWINGRFFWDYVRFKVFCQVLPNLKERSQDRWFRFLMKHPHFNFELPFCIGSSSHIPLKSVSIWPICWLNLNNNWRGLVMKSWGCSFFFLFESFRCAFRYFCKISETFSVGYKES